jgi:uncharacterized protein (DUF362 family)
MSGYVLEQETLMVPVYFGTYGEGMTKVFDGGLSVLRERSRIHTKPVVCLSDKDSKRALQDYLSGLEIPSEVKKVGMVMLPAEAGPQREKFESPFSVETVPIGIRSEPLERLLDQTGVRAHRSEFPFSVLEPCSHEAHFVRRFSLVTYASFCSALGVLCREPVEPSLAKHDPNAKVVVKHFDSGLEIADLVFGAVSELGGFEALLDPTEEVIVKPNLHYYETYPSTTRPEMLEVVVTLLREKGYQVKMVESSGPDTVYCAQESGLLDCCERLGIPFIPIEIGDCVSLKTDFDEIPYVDVYETFYNARNLVCLAQMKTHEVAGMTSACKHLFGTVSKTARYQAHRAAGGKNPDYAPMHKLIAFLNKVIVPSLTIVDAQQSLMGAGPGFFLDHKREEEAYVETENLLLAGCDTLALDLWTKAYLDEKRGDWNPSEHPTVDYLTYLQGETAS